MRGRAKHSKIKAIKGTQIEVGDGSSNKSTGAESDFVLLDCTTYLSSKLLS